ncbi:hypothetical protein RUM43_014692 [Polyplax serrata]|uniref:Uncharacterized protein n=1 Tax=Polyplax serrata TaxID=468196 RepID=A0AAN8PSP3_POLSC
MENIMQTSEKKAYMKPRSNALRIAKLAAFTVIVSSIILGGFILAASWIQANTARNLDLTLNQVSVRKLTRKQCPGTRRSEYQLRCPVKKG